MKFRAKVINAPESYPEMEGKWFYGYYYQDLHNGKLCHFLFNCPVHFEIDIETLGMETEFTDNKGKTIYVGDIIKMRVPYRSTQTHIGDNIPNGSYTEPMEPEIDDIEVEVVFKDGIVSLVDIDGRNFGDGVPVAWSGQPKYDRERIADEIQCTVPCWLMHSEAEQKLYNELIEDDLAYLYDEYPPNNLEELIEYLNVYEIVGTIHDEDRNF